MSGRKGPLAGSRTDVRGDGTARISRREALATGGALIVSFTLGSPARAGARGKPATGGWSKPQGALELPGSLRVAPLLDAWLRIDAHGRITVFTGKAELGQGIETALIQVAAEELAVEPASITLVTADTARTPDEGYTAGSHSMQDSGTAILNAAAQAREILLGLAAQRLKVPRAQVRARGGAVLAAGGRRIAYGALVAARTFHVRAAAHSHLTDPKEHRVIGFSVPRVDIPPKLTGGAAFVQDLRLPGMVHARVVRPPSYGARLLPGDFGAVRRLAGVLHIVHSGRYLAVVATREYQAILAMEALARIARWEEGPSLPREAQLYSDLTVWPSRRVEVGEHRGASAPAARTLEAEYRRPYQMHASIGPSCAVALFESDALTVWTQTQGVYPLRRALAELVRLPVERVRCIQVEGAGCYGHNGADDAAADAALIAREVPDRPVRVQWMRADEHRWEPYGPAMLARIRGALDDGGHIVSWHYEVWSNTHSTRPGGAGELMPAWHIEPPFSRPPPRPIPLPAGGGDRNALPLYRIPNLRADYRFVPKMPLRVSALRSLGAYMNVFAIESFLEDLAHAAQLDPVELRLRHLDDPRAAQVIRMASDRFGWAGYSRLAGHGRGFGFARYKNLAAYAAIAMEVSVDEATGVPRVLRAVAAVDCGEAVNPDGIRNQVEGGIVQAASWTLYEAVRFDRTRITSHDWSSYPILRFSAVPHSLEVHVVDRPGLPFLGIGEAAQGPAAAALGNAIADAVGRPMRELPLTPARILAALRSPPAAV